MLKLFENTCYHGEIKCCVLKKYLFNTLMTLMLLYDVEVWGDNIHKSTWKEFDQNHLITNLFLKSRNQLDALSYVEI